MDRPIEEVVAFLCARLDEDEAAANAVYGRWRAHGERGIVDDSYAAVLIADVDPATRAFILAHDPARMARLAATSRAILRRCVVRMNELDAYPNGLISPRALLARQILADLAAIYKEG